MYLITIDPEEIKTIESVIINMETEEVDINTVPELIDEYKKEIEELNLDRKYLTEVLPILDKLQEVDNFRGIDTFYAMIQSRDMVSIRNERLQQDCSFNMVDNAKRIATDKISKIDKEKRTYLNIIIKLEPFKKWDTINFWHNYDSDIFSDTFKRLSENNKAVVLIDEDDL